MLAWYLLVFLEFGFWGGGFGFGEEEVVGLCRGKCIVNFHHHGVSEL